MFREDRSRIREEDAGAKLVIVPSIAVFAHYSGSATPAGERYRNVATTRRAAAAARLG